MLIVAFLPALFADIRDCIVEGVVLPSLCRRGTASPEVSLPALKVSAALKRNPGLWILSLCDGPEVDVVLTDSVGYLGLEGFLLHEEHLEVVVEILGEALEVGLVLFEGGGFKLLDVHPERALTCNFCLGRASDQERVLKLLDFQLESDFGLSLHVFNLGIQNHVLVADFDVGSEERKAGEFSLEDSDQFEGLFAVDREGKL